MMNNSGGNKRKRSAISAKEKHQKCIEKQNNPKLTNKEIATRLGYDKSTVSDILKEQNK